VFQAVLESTVCWNHVNPAAELGFPKVFLPEKSPTAYYFRRVNFGAGEPENFESNQLSSKLKLGLGPFDFAGRLQKMSNFI